ncbi:MAG: hypothetical protein HYX67_15900, partial [Candidatus Melainabacteria bacterium]|nr:hypothetical protein [Candidatus Melainabacteria bacterium]
MKLFLFSMCLISPLLANAPPLTESGSLSSTDASYDGNSLTLTGHVVLDHGLGKMTAEEASLQRQETGKDFPFSFIQLRKDVVLALKNSAHITCGSADLDFTSLKGVLLPSEGGKVVYSDVLKKKKAGETMPLKLSGQIIELSFSNQAQEGKKTEYEVQNILAKHDVVIEYADNFMLTAGRAIYRKELAHDNKTSKREFQGVVTAYPKDAATKCRLTHDSDVIDAEMVDLDLVHSKITLLHPNGVLANTTLPNVQKGEMRFKADHLLWDQVKNILTLQGHVQIDDSVLGTLQAQDELQIAQTLVKGKRQLKSIQSRGPAALNYRDNHEQTHKLITQGTVNIDSEKLKATIESPEKEGVIAQDKQLYYEEEEIAVYADNASLEYSIEDDSMQPTLLTLKGNIRLFSHDPEKPLRCGSADRLTY